MTLILYGHPLSSFTHKVLVAMYELATPFEFRRLDPSQAADRDLIAGLTPMGKFPALRDEAAGVTVAETSVIIGYLDARAGGGRLGFTGDRGGVAAARAGREDDGVRAGELRDVQDLVGEQADEDDPLSGTEVAAVDGDRERAQRQPPGVPHRLPGAVGRQLARRALDEDGRRGAADQPRDDALERLGRREQQQRHAGGAAEKRGDQQRPEPAALTPQLRP